MNKELTPLEALESIRECLFWSDEGKSKLNIIETALKDYEKKSKALEIIKEIFDSFRIEQKDYNEISLIADFEYVMNEDDFDLLKEVLK